MKFEITSERIDSKILKTELGDVRAGGFVEFEGWVRDHNDGRRVLKLEYEAFETLAVSEGEAILRECRERFDIYSARCVHRVGSLALGETAVWVGVTAAHREEAFRACRYVIDEVKTRLPIWKKEHYLEGDAQWVNCQECRSHAHSEVLGDTEQLFYSRQMRLKEVGETGQDKLRAASVLVVGAGGLGCPVARSLAASGVGHLTILDKDLVEVSNLHRQSLYRFADCGRPKAALAKKALEALNPFIDISAVEEALDFDNVGDWVARHDVIVDCTDDLATKFLLHDFCQRAGKPFVMASVYQWEGEVQAFPNDGTHACLRCLWPELPSRDCVETCEESGVIEAVPGLVGSLQAKFVLDLLLGRPVETRKTLIQLEGLELLKIQGSLRADCWLCAKEEPLSKERYEEKRTEWSVRPRALEILGREFELIDIRESDERDGGGNSDRLLRTMARSDVADYAALDLSKKYLLICQRGRRSAVLSRALRGRELTQFYSLEGGVEGLAADMSGPQSAGRLSSPVE